MTAPTPDAKNPRPLVPPTVHRLTNVRQSARQAQRRLGPQPEPPPRPTYEVVWAAGDNPFASAEPCEWVIHWRGDGPPRPVEEEADHADGP